LGLFAHATYATCSSPLTPADLVLLFTDGLFEVLSADGREDYGQARLLAAAQRHLHLSPQEILDALFSEVLAFSGVAEFNDDVCLLGMEVGQIEAPGSPMN